MGTTARFDSVARDRFDHLVVIELKRRITMARAALTRYTSTPNCCELNAAFVPIADEGWEERIVVVAVEGDFIDFGEAFERPGSER